MGLHYKGFIFSVLLLLPNLLFIIMPPTKIPLNKGKESLILTAVEQIGRIACFILPILLGKRIASQQTSIWVIGMAICLSVYYLLWLQYVIKGCRYYDLFKPLGCIPIPMALFPIFYLLFLGLWIQSPLLILFTLLFAVGHISISWHTYCDLT